VDDEEDAKVEEEGEEKKPKTRKIEKTTWDWELLNNAKPIWTRKYVTLFFLTSSANIQYSVPLFSRFSLNIYRPAEVEENKYEEFYKAITKDTQAPMAHIHFVAEGEVTFKSLLYVPAVQPSESFNKYGTRTDNIKVIDWLMVTLFKRIARSIVVSVYQLYVRRVFITDDFQDIMPNYLNFIRGVDDLPLNVL